MTEEQLLKTPVKELEEKGKLAEAIAISTKKAIGETA